MQIQKNNILSVMVIILILLVFIFYLISSTVHEKFITWYLPFYKSVESIVPKYLMDNITYSNLKFRYTDKITFYFNRKYQVNNTLHGYYDFIFSTILKNILIKNLEIKFETTHLEQIQKVSVDSNHFSIVSSPIMFHLINKNIKSIQNINFIASISFEYLFIVTLERTGIIALDGIKDKRINIGAIYSESYFISLDILQNLNYDTKKDVKLYNYDINEAFTKMFNDEIDCIIMTDFYPSNILNKYIYQNFENNIFLVPFQGLNFQLFKMRHRYMEQVSIDLNNLPKNYLPKKIGDENYTIYKPDFTSFKYSKYIICNQKLNPSISYQIVESIANNLPLINSSPWVKKNPLNQLSFAAISYNYVNIATHPGAKIYFTNKSTFTQHKSELCRYYVGNLKCTDRKVEEANIANSLA